MIPTIGRIVIYKLTEQDAERVNGDARASNSASAGDEYPAMVVRTWGDTPGSSVQLQVFIDGAFTLWATSVSEGDGERQWHWPARV